VLRALERDRRQRYQSAEELRARLRGYLKAEHVVVAQSGVAGLLKRVVGERVEQRRQAIRAALKALSRQPVATDLLSAETGVHPTGKDRSR
jgi:hypothetical protein